MAIHIDYWMKLRSLTLIIQCMVNTVKFAQFETMTIHQIFPSDLLMVMFTAVNQKRFMSSNPKLSLTNKHNNVLNPTALTRGRLA